MNVRLQIGERVVDLLAPLPQHLDLRAMEQHMWTIRRFSSAPKALILRQHTSLVRRLAVDLKASTAAQVWAEHHDDHEALIGDIVGPLKAWINANMRGMTLNDMEAMLDRAICARRGLTEPTEEIRTEVHHYDKLAETLEWRFALGRDPEPWNKPWAKWMSLREAQDYVAWAQSLTPPPGLM